MNSGMEALLHLFFKVAFFLFISVSANAVDITSFYVASCGRHTGIVLKVDRNQVTFLNLDGKIVSIPRYEIIYQANYPLDIVPLKQIVNPKAAPAILVRTRQDEQLVDLVSGWPIDFTEDRISFLTIKGQGQVIDKDSIWEIKELEVSTALEFIQNLNASYEFVHPYAFEYCQPEYAGKGKTKNRIYPQQLLNEPVMIKRDLDRLMRGHELMDQYRVRQQFYAVPQIYNNEASLGMWLSIGSRYGASSNRANNFTPILIDKLSRGPFSYQHLIQTGSAPMMFAIHEEPQMQFYYRFKSDYFHFSAMMDPNLFLVGTKYKWQRSDFESQIDDGINDSSILELGFDYGAFSLELFFADSLNVGTRYGDLVSNQYVNLPRFGLLYETYSYKLEAMFGSVSADLKEVGFARFNGSYRWSKKLSLDLSYIRRSVKHSPRSSTDPGDQFHYESQSNTLAVYGHYRWSKKYMSSAFISVENHSAKAGVSSIAEKSEDKTYPKAGINFALIF